MYLLLSMEDNHKDKTRQTEHRANAGASGLKFDRASRFKIDNVFFLCQSDPTATDSAIAKHPRSDFLQQQIILVKYDNKKQTYVMFKTQQHGNSYMIYTVHSSLIGNLYYIEPYEKIVNNLMMCQRKN